MKKLTFQNRAIGLILIFSSFLHTVSFSKHIMLKNGATVSMCDNVTDGGLIQGSETGCPNPIFDPSPITNVALPTGGSGDLEYLWIFTEDDPNGSVVSWLPIPNSNSPDFDPGPITVETHYMRCARRTDCVEYSGESNFVTKSIECCDNVTDGGVIQSDQIICDTLFNPDPLENISAPSGGSGNVEYQWFQNITGVPFDINNPDWLPISGANNESYDPDVLGETTFFIRCSRREGCMNFVGKSNIVTVSITQGPAIDTVFLNNVSCFGGNDGNINLLISASTGVLTFNWSGGLFPTPIQRNLMAGVYSVTIADIFGCDVIDTIEVTQPDPIEISTGFTTENCNFQNGGLAYANVVSGAQGLATFQWDDAASSTTDTIRNLPEGIYTVIATDTSGCTGTESVDLILNDALSANIQSMSPSCFGFSDGELTVAASGGSGNYSYQWSDSNNTIGETLTGVPTGNYFVTISDGNDCEIVELASLSEPDPISLSVQTVNGGCTSLLGSATANASGGIGNFTYQWNDPLLQTTQTAIDLPEQSYEVTVIDENGCSAMQSFSIFNNSNFSITIGFEGSSCLSGDIGTAGVVPNGGFPPYSFEWSTGELTDTIRNLAPGIYTVTVIDSDGCERIESVEIENITPINLDITTTNVDCSDDENGAAEVEITGGLPPYSMLWSTMSQDIRIEDLEIGNYALTVVDQNGCEEIAPFEITSRSNLSGNLEIQNIQCFGFSNGSLEYNVFDGFGIVDFEWSNNSNTALLQNLAAGTFSVIATDELGCQIFDTATIVEPDQIICDIDILTEINLNNSMNGELAIDASGGTGIFNFEWSTGANTNQISNLAAGSYSVTVFDENGCQCNSSVELINPARIEGFTWTDENENGIQDLNEVGLEGVSVNLTGVDNNGQFVDLIFITNMNGRYEFDGLIGGDYELSFSLPTNFVLTNENVGNDDTIDSDVNPTSQIISNINLVDGMVQIFDAGYFMQNQSVDIGDFIWFDSNRDGIQNSFENGIANITIFLIEAATGNRIMTRTSNISGRYLFNNVPPGNYFIEFSPLSLPSGFIYTQRNIGNDDELDSDVDENGQTEVFSVVENQNDNLNLDAGIFAECDNVTSGGTIVGDESLCGPNDPSEIMSSTLPSGGAGDLEFLWLRSNTPVYNGQSDPNWEPIPNSNTPSYDPDLIFVSTYYIRCSRRQGCPDFPGESNVVKKEILSVPSANILNPPSTVCEDESTRFTAESLGGGTSYAWDFDGAMPGTSNARVVNGVNWQSTGTKTVQLEVTRFGCSSIDQAIIEVLPCSSPLGNFNYFELEQFEDVFTKIKWNTSTDDNETFFDIQKSIDGSNFERIQTLNGNDNTLRDNYVVADYDVIEGNSFYRIRHYNTSGVAVFSDIKEMHFENDGNEDIYLFPNPSDISFYISNLSEDFIGSAFLIYNSHGSLLMEQIPDYSSEKLEILVSELPQGIYILKSKLDPRFSLKFVVQH